ncbi:MAG TPA: NAD(P)/FAD-dependent oxidoreductase [Thermoanaerobaculia bacterium]
MLDFIVIGGGPGGSTAATLLARKGYSVLLLEKEKFPRFQIGESLLPYNNDIFKRLGVFEEIHAGGYYPKFGAEFLTADGSVSYTFRFERNLPSEYVQSFQVRRATFDQFLLQKSVDSGVDVREQTTVTDVDRTDPNRVIVRAKDREGAVHEHTARFVLDATGHGTVLGSGVKTMRESLKKVSFFAHYRGVKPSAEGKDSGNTVIAVLKNAWFWLIPISEEVTSVGLVVDRELHMGSGLTPEQLLEKTIADSPYVAERMRDAEQVTQVYARKDFSYSVDEVIGPNFALIGDAAGFIDPIFSTGVFLAMKSAELAADAADSRLRTGSMKELKRYRAMLQRGLNRYLGFITNFYRREFLEIFLQPAPHFGMLQAIVGVLAGDVFERRRNRWKLVLFFALVRAQRMFGVIAPKIAWDKLPEVRPAQEQAAA